jgi:phospholipase C
MEDMMSTGELAAIDHIVVLMLENRSFDHMLGFLYADRGNVSPAGQSCDGLTGHESNPDTTSAAETHFGQFPAFQAAAAAGKLPPFTFLEPSWGSSGNSHHSNYNVALGEQLIHDLYYALRKGPGWNKTSLIVTYDEHGGCYDHVAPPTNAVPPDNTAGEYGFDFKRFGLRVPTVLISPLIPPGTVFRVPAGTTPLDHTSILKTIEQRWQLPALTKRDAAAPGVGAVLSLNAPRTDDPLQGVTVPQAKHSNPPDPRPSHLELVHAEQISRLPVPDAAGGAHHEMPVLRTSSDTHRYIKERVAAWKAARARGSAN